MFLNNNILSHFFLNLKKKKELNGNTNVENKCIDTKGGKVCFEGRGTGNWEIGIDIPTLLILWIK